MPVSPLSTAWQDLFVDPRPISTPRIAPDDDAIGSPGPRSGSATAWMDLGSCRQSADGEAVWFADTAGSDGAAGMCGGCPVRRECLAHAVVVEVKDRRWDGPGRLEWELQVGRARRPGPSFQAVAAR